MEHGSRHGRLLRLLVLPAAVLGMVTGSPAVAQESAAGPARTDDSGAIAQGDWTQYRNGPRHRGVSPTETILSPTNVDDLEARWRYPIGDPVATSVTIARGRAFVGALDGRMHALDVDTGERIWAEPSDALDGDTVWTTAVIRKNVVYFAANRPWGVLYALDARTGEELWTVGFASTIIASPTLAKGVLYLGFNDHYVKALDARTGAELWTAGTASGMYASPTVAGERVIVNVHNYGLLALDRSTGEELWSGRLPGPQLSAPAVAGGRVYVGSRDDQAVYAFDLATGDRLWRFVTTAWVHAPPAVHDGIVYIGNEGGHLYALDASDGSQVWRVRVSSSGTTEGAAFANGVLYVATGLGDGRLYAVDAASGETLFSDFVGDGDGSGDGNWVTSSPTVVDGNVYIASYEDDSFVTAFALPED